MGTAEYTHIRRAASPLATDAILTNEALFTNSSDPFAHCGYISTITPEVIHQCKRLVCEEDKSTAHICSDIKGTDPRLTKLHHPKNSRTLFGCQVHQVETTETSCVPKVMGSVGSAE